MRRISVACDGQPPFIPMLPSYQSGIRRLVSDTNGLPYHPLRSLIEARSYADGVVILEGDFGGQIFAVCHASDIHCSLLELEQLVEDLNMMYWPNSPLDGAQVFYERLPMGAPVAGGEGGGWVTDGIWIHPWLVEDGMATVVRDVIAGKLSRLPGLQHHSLDSENDR